MTRWALREGDCLALLPQMPDGKIDAVVTDPPYGLEFMGKEWDRLGAAQEWHHAWAAECFRVLKPGGYLLAFGGTRTYHRLACAIEDAGFEIRDSIIWMYGTGFPKSMDVGKAIDKAAGAKRTPRNGQGDHEGTVDFGMKNRCPDCGKPFFSGNPCTCPRQDRVPVTDEAKQWDGWGTALKPGHEPVVMARKPLIGTVAANVLAHGTGALNINACRIEANGRPLLEGDYKQTANSTYAGRMDGSLAGGSKATGTTELGRWPANVVLDEDAAAELDRQSGVRKAGTAVHRNGSDAESNASSWDVPRIPRADIGHGDTGGASRFFYCAKASAKERPVGEDGTRHPTVKPVALMRWLVRLVTPPGGIVLDPFVGSGTTMEAALAEGFQCFAVESDQKYAALARARLREKYPEGEA